MTRPPLIMQAIMTCLIVAGPAIVAAQSPAIEEEMDGAKSLYQNGRLTEAINALRGVIVKLNDLRDAQGRTHQLAEAHFHLGLTYLAMRDESAALENFRQVSALDPDRVLDPEIYSPRVVAMFERARSDVVRTLPDDRSSQPPGEGGQPTAVAGVAALVPGEALLRILPGTKMRVERTGPRLAVEGQLLAINGNMLTIGGSNWRLDVPRETMTRVQVVTARKNHWIAGMVIGTGLGVLIGALEVPGCEGNDGDCYTRGENMGYGGLGAGMLGALVGALYRTDQWADVSLERQASAPAPRRLALSFSWQY